MTDAPLSGLRIGLLTSCASRLGGGVFEAVVKQADLIRSLGGEAVVFALEDVHSAEDKPRFGPAPVHVSRVSGPRQIGFAPDLAGRMIAADLDLLHLHGIWMFPSRAATVWARRTGRPYLISPHGMLDPWIVARGKAKKFIARKGYEEASWQAATAFHALTHREAGDVLRESGRRESIVVANAGPEPAAPRAGLPAPSFVYLGRIHTKKNLEALVAAWRDNARALEALGATLTIAGWGDDADVAALKGWLEGAPASVRFAGPVFGEAKAALLGGAHHLVLPSHSEGLPMVILEAWAAGAPVLMTQECNLPEGFAAGAARDCGYDAASIGAALLTAAQMGEGEWQAASAAARTLAATTFSNAAIAAQWAQAYRGLVDTKIGAAA